MTSPSQEAATSDRLEAAGFALLRTPRTSFEVLLRWSELGWADVVTRSADAAAQSREPHSDPWNLGYDRLRAGLATWLDDLANREALFLATPGFEAVAGDRLVSPDQKRRLAAERSLVGYLSRAVSRPTPFGLFAGTSLLRLGDHTNLQILGDEHDRRTTRIDTGVLEDFARRLAAQPELRRRLVLRANPTVRRVGDRLHLTVVESESGEPRVHTIAIESTEILALILAETRLGLTYEALRSRLQTLRPSATPDQIATWIEELIDTQFLHPDFGPAVTDSAVFGGLLESLTQDQTVQNTVVPDATAELHALAKSLEALDQPGRAPTTATADYARIQERFRIPSASTGNPFQVDLWRPSPAATLSRDLVQEVLGAVHWLHRFTPPRRDSLAQLVESFESRFGDTEVPLSLVFDEEFGIAFDDEPGQGPSALLEDLREPVQPRVLGDGELPATVEPRLDRALAQRATVLALADFNEDGEVEDESSANARPRLPLSGAIKGAVFLPAAKAPAQFHLHAFMGRPGTSLLGRPALNDAELLSSVREHCQREEMLAGEALIAEIVHQPGGAASHLQQRPQLSDWEIVYLGQSRRPPGRRIEVDDLRVRLVEGRFHLRSQTLDREVIPRLSSAHDFRSAALPVYRFLAELQHHGASSWLQWSWGHRSLATYLPRVTLGRVILARQRWRIDPVEVRGWSRLKSKRFQSVSEWRRAHRLPRFAFWVDGESELLFDFDNPMMVDAFVDRVPDGSAAVLEEMLDSPDRLAAHGPQGSYLHDLVLPVTRSRPRSPPRADRKSQASSPPIARSPRIATGLTDPLPDWTQLEVSCGPVTADRVLSGALKPWLNGSTHPATDWFFVRYSDPHPHLRLRLRLPPSDHAVGEASLLQSWNSATDNLAIWRLAIGRYEPEIERYGGPAAMRFAEQIFAADSAAAVQILTTFAEEGDRWRVALLGVDRLLEDFGLDLKEKRRQISGLADTIGAEIWESKANRTTFNRRFREERSELEALVAGELDSEPLFAGSLQALAARSAALAEPIRSWRRAASPPQPQSTEDPIQAFVHMHCNRVLRWPGRRQEAVIYQVLLRLYDSYLARGRRPRGADPAPGFRSSVGRSA